MAQTNYTPISLYYSTTASAVPTAANLVQGELAINTNDGKLYYEDSSGVVQTLASKAGALGDVVGPASATDNALARFDLTTGKLIQNSVGILSDAGILTGLTGLTSSGSITLSSLTSGRVTYAGASGLLSDSANLTFDGTNLLLNAATPNLQGTSSTGSVSFVNNSGGAFIRLFGGSHATRANFTDFINGASTSTFASSGNLGIGNSNPDCLISVEGVDGAVGGAIRYTATGVCSAFMSADASGLCLATDTAGITFRTGVTGNDPTDTGSERMRIDSSGNVGIGTTSPIKPLQIGTYGVTNGEIALASTTTGYGSILFGDGASGSDYYRGYVQYQHTSDAMLFATSTLERMRIDSSGNVGLGVTPNWGSAVLFPAFQIGVASAFMSGQGSTEGFYAGSNAYYSAGWNYKVNGYATHIRQQDGAHAWFTAPSGTAGNAITFTQAMTLDASGNLLVGTTSSLGGKLEVGSSYVRSSNGASSQGVGYVAGDSAGNDWHFGRSSANGYYYIVTQAGTGQYMVTGSSAWTAVSDERHKENLVPITDALSKVNTLRAVTGNLTSEKNNTKPYLIAQDVQKVLPEAVDSSNPEKLGLAYTDVIPLLVAAIKELKAEVDLLKQQLNGA